MSMPSEHERQAEACAGARPILAIRCHSGISGDILVAGLAALALRQAKLEPGSGAAAAWLAELAGLILPELGQSLRLEAAVVNGIAGWRASVDLPHSHEHRGMAEITAIIEAGALAEAARRKALGCFELLAACEAAAHGVGIEAVHFHEAGALDSILDICAACELWTRLGQPTVAASPLPMADGEILCAHGLLPAPAPAVLRLLESASVVPFAGSAQAGELVTPTGIALLRALEARFGAWPAFAVEATCIAYGQKVFPGAANGAIFALGSAAD